MVDTLLDPEVYDLRYILGKPEVSFSISAWYSTKDRLSFPDSERCPYNLSFLVILVAPLVVFRRNEKNRGLASMRALTLSMRRYVSSKWYRGVEEDELDKVGLGGPRPGSRRACPRVRMPASLTLEKSSV